VYHLLASLKNNDLKQSFQLAQTYHLPILLKNTNLIVKLISIREDGDSVTKRRRIALIKVSKWGIHLQVSITSLNSRSSSLRENPWSVHSGNHGRRFIRSVTSWIDRSFNMKLIHSQVHHRTILSRIQLGIEHSNILLKIDIRE
jgi:hypothetical protein